MVLTELKKEFMTDKASFRAIIEQWPTVKCYNIKRFLQFSASTKPHDKTLICYYFLSSGCAKGKTKKLKIVLSKFKKKTENRSLEIYFVFSPQTDFCWLLTEPPHPTSKGFFIETQPHKMWLRKHWWCCWWASQKSWHIHPEFLQKKIAIILLAFNVLLSTFWLVLVIIDPKSWLQTASKKQ